MKNIGVRIVVTVFAVLLVLVLARNILAKTIVENGVHFATGLDLKMRKLDIGLFNAAVGIHDLRLLNPKGFGDDAMLDMPNIFIDVELDALGRNKVHIKEITINLKEFSVVKNKEGNLNLNSIKTVSESKKPAKAQQQAEKAEAKPKGKAPNIQIDRLDLKIGKVIYKDYSKDQPSTKEFPVNINERYENITNLNAVMSIILVKALSSTTIAQLTGFDLGPLSSSVSNTLNSSTQLASHAAAMAEERLAEHTEEARALARQAQQEIAQRTAIAGEAAEKARIAAQEATAQAQETAKKAQESLSSAAKSLGNGFKSVKLPFGKEETAQTAR